MKTRRQFIRGAALWVPPLFAIARARGQALSLADPASVRKAQAAASYLMNETFESGTAPSGWTAADSRHVYNTSTSGLGMDGTYCLAMSSASGSTETVSADVAGQTEIWAYFKFRTTSYVNGTTPAILRDGSGNRALQLYCPGGGTRLYVGGGSFNSFGASLANDTTYHCWMHWKSDGTGDAGFSTDGVKPSGGSLYCTITGGSGVSSAVRIAHIADSTGGTNYWDTVKLSASPIGDNGI